MRYAAVRYEAVRLGLLFLAPGRHPNVNGSVTGAMETQGGAQLTREEKVAVVEAYLNGLVSKDISKVPFATDITFEGPRVPPLAGREGRGWISEDDSSGN